MSDYSEAVLGELERAGVEYRIVHGRRHKMVEWFTPAGRRQMCQADTTASDHRSAMNARHQVRRMLRAAGLCVARRA